MFRNLFKRSNKGNKRERIFGLVLREESAVALLLEADRATASVRVVDRTNFSLSNSWEYLVEDVDEALFRLEKQHNVKLGRIIFFLYSHIIDQKTNKIKKPYDQKIKSLVKNLELGALGFIQFHEALALDLAAREESALTSIVLELDRPSVTLLVYRGGDVVHAESFARREDLVVDLEEVFEKLKSEVVLPSRVIMYDAADIEEVASKILSHKWSEKLFIQLPKVEVVQDEKLERALVSVFAKQFFERSEADEIVPDVDHVMGFHIGVDVGEGRRSDEGPSKPDEEVFKDKPPGMDEPADETREMPGDHQKEDDYGEEIARDAHGDDEFETVEEGGGAGASVLTGLFDRLRSFWPPSFLALSSLKTRGPIPSHVLILVIGLLLILSSALSVLYFFHKATLTVYFEGERVERELELVGVVGGSASKNKLPLKRVKKSVEQKDTIKTSGTKLIGKKATGEVTVYNREPSQRSFAKGTKLAAGGVFFLLQSDIKVASASETITDEGDLLTVTGKATAQLEAQEIGPAGNIGPDKQLTIADFSDSQYFAVTKTAFTGGSQDELRTVSRDDIAALEERIIKKVKKDNDKLLAEEEVGRGVLADLSDIDITKAKYSAEVGEEARELTVEATLALTLYTYSEEELEKIISDVFKKAVPKGYELAQKSITYKVADVTEGREDIDITLDISGRALPKVKRDSLVRDLLGKTGEDAEAIVKDKYKARGYKMTVRAPLSPLRGRLPFFKQNITLRVESL